MASHEISGEGWLPMALTVMGDLGLACLTVIRIVTTTTEQQPCEFSVLNKLTCSYEKCNTRGLEPFTNVWIFTKNNGCSWYLTLSFCQTTSLSIFKYCGLELAVWIWGGGVGISMCI